MAINVDDIVARSYGEPTAPATTGTTTPQATAPQRARVMWTRARQPGYRVYVAIVATLIALCIAMPALMALVFTSHTAFLLALVPLFLIGAVLGDNDRALRVILLGIASVGITAMLATLFAAPVAGKLDWYAINRIGTDEVSRMAAYGAFRDDTVDRMSGAFAYAGDYWSEETSITADEVKVNLTCSTRFFSTADREQELVKWKADVREWEAEYKGGVKVARALHAIDRAVPKGAPTFNMDDPRQAAKADQYGKPHWRIYPSTGSRAPQGYLPGEYTGISGMPKRPEPARVRRPTPTPQAAQPAPTARPTAGATPVQVSTTGDAVTMSLTVGDIINYRSSVPVTLEGPLRTSTHPAYAGPKWWGIRAKADGAYTLRGADQFVIERQR